MKCCFCNGDGKMLTTTSQYICYQCVEKMKLVTCTKIGKVIISPEFQCDNICNDCIYEEEVK